MVPPAPGRLSMTMLCPRIDVRRCPIRRAITSAGPAGAKPTTILTGLLGNVCADAMPLAAQATATMPLRNVGLASMAVAPDFIPKSTRERPSRSMRPKGIASRLLIHHAVAQRADAGNLDLEHVAGLHPQRRIAAMTDPFRRAGGDHVARRKRREVRAEGDDLRHGIDQEIGAGLLHLLPVQSRRERETGRIR